ncbi:hypothetical protein JHK87_055585 [Glycine soja]|nr:hypothetical protein JHK87_055585 [Glycine soja]
MFRGNNDDEFEFDGGFDFDKEEALYKELETLIHSENTAPSMMFPLEDATHVHSGDSDSDGGSDNNKLQVFELENSLVQLPPKLSSLSVPPPTESMLPHTQFHGGFDEWDDTLVYLPPIEETLDQLENTAPRLLSPSAEETLDHLLSLSTPMLLQELLESKNTAPAPSLLPLSTPMLLQDTLVHLPPLSLPDNTSPRVFTPAGHITLLPQTQTANRPSTSSASSSHNRCNRWTNEEHMLFLQGLAIYGKGGWKNIARYAVKTRTSTQVASHAQKYFLHLRASNKKAKRKSIYDMTLQDQVPPPHQHWVLPPNLATY